MAKRVTRILLPALLMVLLSFTAGCNKNKHISYVDMLKREAKEIKAFMDKEGMTIIKEFPANGAMNPKEYVEVKEGLYINIVNKGNGTKPESGKTTIHTRFTVESLADQGRYKATNPLFSNLEGSVGGTKPLNFIYQEKGTQMNIDPTTESDNVGDQLRYASEALIKGASYVTDGGVVRIITSFRSGPTFTTKEGIPLFYREVQYNFKK